MSLFIPSGRPRFKKTQTSPAVLLPCQHFRSLIPRLFFQRFLLLLLSALAASASAQRRQQFADYDYELDQSTRDVQTNVPSPSSDSLAWSIWYSTLNHQQNLRRSYLTGRC